LDGENGEALESLDGSARGGERRRRRCRFRTADGTVRALGLQGVGDWGKSGDKAASVKGKSCGIGAAEERGDAVRRGSARRLGEAVKEGRGETVGR